MIRIKRSAEPQELPACREKLLREYIKDERKLVWNEVPDLRESLLAMSHRKCAYCEQELTQESLTVDHFVPRKFAKQLVLTWTNLLPSCKKCNNNKGSFDTSRHEFINPCEDEPPQYLALNLRTLRFESKGSNGRKAQNTIDKLKLNDLSDKSKLIGQRFNIKKQLEKELQKILENFDPENISNTILGLTNLLSYAQDGHKMSAVYATLLLNQPDYQKLKDRLISVGAWGEELSVLEDKAQQKQLV